MPEFTISGGEVTKVGIWTGHIIEFAGVRYKVTKINPKNYKLMRETDGHTFTLRKDAYGIKKSDNQEWKGPKEKTEWDLYQESVEAGITLGTVVEMTAVNLASAYPGKWVVIAMPNNGTLRLAKLGGDGGKYLRNIKPTEVKVSHV